MAYYINSIKIRFYYLILNTIMIFIFLGKEILWNFGLIYRPKLDEKRNIIKFFWTVVETLILDVSNFGTLGTGTKANIFLFNSYKLYNYNEYGWKFICLSFFRNELESNICSITPESFLCPSPRVRNRFRKSWIEPQSMIRLIISTGMKDI